VTVTQRGATVTWPSRDGSWRDKGFLAPQTRDVTPRHGYRHGYSDELRFRHALVSHSGRAPDTCQARNKEQDVTIRMFYVDTATSTAQFDVHKRQYGTPGGCLDTEGEERRREKIDR